MIGVLKRTVAAFFEDGCTTLAAALAYYTIFALPPLLYLLLTILTHSLQLVNDSDQASQQARMLIESQAGQLLGNEAAADEVSTILEQNRRAGGTWWKSILSLAGILFGATGVMIAIQTSLNKVWHVRVDPQANRLRLTIRKRLLSLAMILSLGFLLIVSMILSTVFHAIGQHIGSAIGSEQSLARGINATVTLAVVALVFAALFKFMPDAIVRWRDVWVGAIGTAILFGVGQYLMGIYFAVSSPGAQLGNAAAAIAVLLVWVYYSSIIFLFGAEFTQAWACRFGEGVQPEPHAVKVEQQLIRP